MLICKNLTILSGDFRLVADFSIPEGACVAILGPSGAGKSTLLNVIAGFFDQSDGEIIWNDTDIGKKSPAERPIAMLFQDNNLFPHMTAAQNVALGLRPNLRLSRDDHAIVAAALDRVGLAGFGARKPAQLSGGQQSRVALARVLVQRRALILLDEPFAALGPALRVEMLDLMRDLATETGATVLMVSHDPADARRIAESVIVVADGVAHAPAPTEATLNNPPEALRSYLGQ